MGIVLRDIRAMVSSAPIKEYAVLTTVAAIVWPLVEITQVCRKILLSSFDFSTVGISSTFVECVCPAGYAGNGIGPNGCVRSLLPDQGPCYPNPCRHGMCRLNGTSDYVCECYSRYTGK